MPELENSGVLQRVQVVWDAHAEFVKSDPRKFSELTAGEKARVLDVAMRCEVFAKELERSHWLKLRARVKALLSFVDRALERQGDSD